MSEAEAPPEKKDSGPSTPKGPLILGLVNILAVLGALGVLVYTQILFKREPITEVKERKRLTEHRTNTSRMDPSLPTSLIPFEDIKANIAGGPNGELRVLALSLHLEVRTGDDQKRFETLKPVFLDRLLALLGKKTFAEINSVQGRYILRSQIAEIVNDLMAESRPDENIDLVPLVTNVYFSEFQVQ